MAVLGLFLFWFSSDILFPTVAASRLSQDLVTPEFGGLNKVVSHFDLCWQGLMTCTSMVHKNSENTAVLLQNPTSSPFVANKLNVYFWTKSAGKNSLPESWLVSSPDPDIWQANPMFFHCFSLCYIFSPMFFPNVVAGSWLVSWADPRYMASWPAPLGQGINIPFESIPHHLNPFTFL